MKKLATTALLSVLAACSSTTSGGGGDGSTDKDFDPPTIEIESPARGTMAEGGSIRVTGRVTDAGSGVAEVRINDQVATLDGDSFSLDLAAPAGIAILQTRATDVAGNVGSDNRAVLLGDLADQGTPITDGVVAKLDGGAMGGMAQMISSFANGTNFTALATALNPVVDTGSSCNSAKVFVESINKSGVPVTAQPVAGGINTRVSIRGLDVRGRVTFRALCISGSASWRITATAYNVGGRIAPTLTGGDIAIGLDGVTSGFDGFNLDVNNIPGFVENLFEDQVRNKLADIMRDKVREMVPQMATSFLQEFLADSYAVDAMGQTIDLSIKPTSMLWDTSGGRISLETTTVVRGVEGASFLSTPTPAPDAMGAGGLSVALADDVANQLMAGMWASGALELGFQPGEGDPVRAFFPEADSVAIQLLLPPVVNADTTTGTMKLAIGDAMVQVIDADQGLGTMAEFAISAEIDLSATLTTDGRMMLQTGSPRVVGQVISQSDSLLVPLDEAKVTAFAELAINQFAQQADALFETLPIPGVPGAELSSPTFEPRGGYVVLTGQIAVQ